MIKRPILAGMLMGVWLVGSMPAQGAVALTLAKQVVSIAAPLYCLASLASWRQIAHENKQQNNVYAQAQKQAQVDQEQQKAMQKAMIDAWYENVANQACCEAQQARLQQHAFLMRHDPVYSFQHALQGCATK